MRNVSERNFFVGCFAPPPLLAIVLQMGLPVGGLSGIIAA